MVLQQQCDSATLIIFISATTITTHKYCRNFWLICSSAFKLVFNCGARKLIDTVDVNPPARLEEACSRMEDVKRQADAAPCGNFSAVYRCVCDQLGIDVMEDVVWVSLRHFCQHLTS